MNSYEVPSSVGPSGCLSTISFPHCNLLPYIIRSCPIKTVLYNRFLRFYDKVNCNKNSYIKLAGVLSLDGSRTSVSNTMCCI
jgi:hypothetical protein